MTLQSLASHLSPGDSLLGSYWHREDQLRMGCTLRLAMTEGTCKIAGSLMSGHEFHPTIFEFKSKIFAIKLSHYQIK